MDISGARVSVILLAQVVSGLGATRRHLDSTSAHPSTTLQHSLDHPTGALVITSRGKRYSSGSLPITTSLFLFSFVSGRKWQRAMKSSKVAKSTDPDT